MRRATLIVIGFLIACAGPAQAAASSDKLSGPKQAALLKKLKAEHDGQKACVDLGDISFPLKLDQKTRRRLEGHTYLNTHLGTTYQTTALEYLEALLGAGLLKRADQPDQPDQPNNPSGQQSSSQDNPLAPRSKPITLALTSDGQRALSRKSVGRNYSYSSFCYGHYQVERVINYSTPAANKDGRIVTRVKSSQSLHGVASWAAKIAKQLGSGNSVQRALDTRAHPSVYHETFISTANGWVSKNNF